MLNQKEKKQLLNIAFKAIDVYISTGKHADLPKPVSDRLMEHRGAFVTLKMHGILRGCIGTFIADKPLIDVVADMAREAAVEDPRFSPVVAEEVKDLEIEISVLTPLQRVTDPKLIEVGRHGIFITRGFHSGVLLPQVATEYGMDRLEFLDQTCIKAGLPKGCWQDPDTIIEVFEAEVFD